MSGAGDFWFAENGTNHYYKDEADGGFTLTMSSDITAALEYNQAQRLHNDGYSQSRELRRAASIPWPLILKWKDEGFDIFNKNNKVELLRRLDDPDWGALRTAEGRLGRGSGRMI